MQSFSFSKEKRKGEKMVRTKKTWRIGGAAIFATGITLASRFDLAISSALSGLTTDGGTFKLSVPKFASLLEIIGEWAPSMLAATSLLIVSHHHGNSEKAHAKAVKRASVIPAAGLVAYASAKTAQYLKLPLNKIGGVMLAALSFVIAALMYLAVGKIPQKARERLHFPAAYTLAASIGVLSSVSAIKTIWGRARLRELVDRGSLEDFTPWYIPKFFSGSYSFPSGHTAHATLVMMLTTWLYGVGEKFRGAVSVLCYGFIVLMAFSRLAAGAHYLSDVLFGFMIAISIVEVAKAKLDKRLRESKIT